MRTYLSVDDAVRIVESAFAPYRCVAESEDYGNRLKFRVFDEQDDPLLTVEYLVKSQFSDQARLIEILESSRENLKNRGIDLHNWEL